MNTYDAWQQKALGLAFILALLIMAIGAAAFALGIGTRVAGRQYTLRKQKDGTAGGVLSTGHGRSHLEFRKFEV